MEKECFSPNDLVIILTQLWCSDYKEYRGKSPDRSRVGYGFAMLMYCFTSARSGEVHESTARRGQAGINGSNLRKFHNTEQARYHFQYTRRVMPERHALAHLLPKCEELRSKDGRETLRAMEALCRQGVAVSYRRSLQPVNGKCLCGKIITTLHLYVCYFNYMKDMGASSFAELCFECDLWFNNEEEWGTHVLEHLNAQEELLRCDPLIFRNAPVRAGYCPFCLGGDLPPRHRMMQFTDPALWYDHIKGHLAYLKTITAADIPLAVKNSQSLEIFTIICGTSIIEDL